MAVFLVPIEDGRPIVLDKAIVLIGRQADCDVVLTNSRRVSRRHCCVAQVNDSFVVRDLGSMNGVRINGQRIKTETPIKFGDVVSIGDLGFVLQGKDVIPSRRNPRQPTDRGEPVRLPQRGLKPRVATDLSQDMPVAIPESEASFAEDAIERSDRSSDVFAEPAGDANDPHDAGDEESPGRGYQGTNSHFELLPD